MPNTRSLRPLARSLSSLLLSTLAAAPLAAQTSPEYAWPPPSSRPTLKLWPAAPPDAHPDAIPEADTSIPGRDLVAGRPLVRLGHVSTPTLTLYQPPGNPTGAAVVVFPGGGYSILAIDLEGTEVCQWLNSAGIACVLLKYRVPDTGPYPKSPAALEDAQRAVSLVRAHAPEWRLDPHRIGVLGFSAGGHLAAALSTRPERLYRSVDAADQLSSRPDFAVLIYPGYLAVPEPQPNGEPALVVAPNEAIHPDAQTPPTFLLQAEDDPVHVENATTYFAQLKQAQVPAELHLYAQGGHGYGLRATARPVTHWPTLVETWLHTIGVLPTP